MDWTVAIEKNREVLARIVAMLIALAVLTERASGLPRPVRCLALWILRPAEAAARDLARDITRAPLQPLAGHLAFGGNDSAGDAIRLALSFRSIAAVLSDASPETLRLAMPGGRCGLAILAIRQRIGAIESALAEPMALCPLRPSPHDTS